MAANTDSTTLDVTTRAPASSRATRRLRREGKVPGILYGRGETPVAFTVGERDLRHALAGSGAVLDVSIDGAATPAVLKDAQRHPVRGEIMHIDLLRVDLTQAITAVVQVEIIGGDDSPGAREGGVVEQITREVNIEALPNAIPESLSYDASELVIGDTILLSALVTPEGVTLLDDLEETTLVTVTPPRLESDLDEIEAETTVIGQEGAAGEDGSGEDAGDSAEGDE